MKKRRFERFAGDLATGNQVFRGFSHSGIGGFDGRGGFVFIAMVEDDYDQAFRFQLRGQRGREICIHVDCF
jgi:hypothetical protein